MKNISEKSKTIIQQYYKIIENLEKPISFIEISKIMGFSSYRALKNTLVLNNIKHHELMNIKFPNYCKICGKSIRWDQKYCSKSCIAKEDTLTEEFFIENKKRINKNILLLEETRFLTKFIKCKCLICNKEFKAQFGYLLQGHAHNSCADRSKLGRSFDEFKQLVENNSPEFELLDITYKSSVKSIVKCKNCGTVREAGKDYLIRGHIRCQRCKSKMKSLPEFQIENFLIKNNIEHKFQKTFKLLKVDKRHALRFDFYLPNYNLCIEYDGQGHYKKDFVFNRTGIVDNSNDIRKNEYCKEHNIKLLRIPYWEQKTMIDKIDLYLKNLKINTYLLINDRFSGCIK